MSSFLLGLALNWSFVGGKELLRARYPSTCWSACLKVSAAAQKLLQPSDQKRAFLVRQVDAETIIDQAAQSTELFIADGHHGTGVPGGRHYYW